MKRLVLGAVLSAAIVFAVAAPASAAEYDTYVGCGTAITTPPAEACVLGSPVGLFFEADEETEYDVCVEFPDGFEECLEGEEAEAGVLSVNELVSDELGAYLVSWYVGPFEVGLSSFRIDPPPAPPVPPAPQPSPAPAPAPTPAPAPAPAPLLPAKSTACVKAEIRVKQFKDLLRKTAPGKPKARNRDRLKAARATAKNLC